MSEVLKVGKADLNPSRILGVSFVLSPEEEDSRVAIDAIMLDIPQQDPDSVIAVHELIDNEGMRNRQYLKLPRRIMESSHIVIECFDSHENLKKAVGGVAIAGAVLVGSLVIKKHHKHHK